MLGLQMILKPIYKPLTLIGFQASGKTTLGQLLADALQCPFVDSDRMIEQFHPSSSCREIHKDFGEIYFRNLESQAISSLNYQISFVLAIGGGALLQEENGRLLKKNSIQIYLKTSPQVLKERIWNNSSLPSYLSTNHPHEDFDAIYQKRVAIHEKWADHTIEMDGLSIQEALECILKLPVSFQRIL